MRKAKAVLFRSSGNTHLHSRRGYAVTSTFELVHVDSLGFRDVAGAKIRLDQALNGTDLVQDPSTGIQYEAPYSAYDRAGPNGPGYYAGSPGSLHKLNVITPG